jgi:hypothetical protein
MQPRARHGTAQCAELQVCPPPPCARRRPLLRRAVEREAGGSHLAHHLAVCPIKPKKRNSIMPFRMMQISMMRD